MDMRIRLQISAERMDNADNSREEALFTSPGEHSLGGSSKEAVKEEFIFIEELSERVRDGKADMMEGSIREARFSFRNPCIGEGFAAGGAESAFTRMGYSDKLFWMLRASVFMVAQRFRVSARKHFLDSGLNIVRDRIFVFLQILVPMILEDLLDGITS